MSDYDYPFDNPDDYDEEEDMNGCDYGAEFCEDPLNKQMGLCTTECKLYFDMVKEQEFSGAWWDVLILWLGVCTLVGMIIYVLLS